MAVFTMRLYEVMEMTDDIGLSEYPIFSEDYREQLNKLITDHYYNREIGQETIAMWRHAMKRRMNEVMPYYNSLYETQRITFDPLSTINIKTVTSGNTLTEASTKAETTSEMTNTGDTRAVQSDTPQVRLSGDGDYATSAADTISESKGTGSGTENQTVNSADKSENESHTSGYQGTPASLIMEYRRSLMNIDLLVIDELSDMFMGVWSNGDDVLPYPYTNLPNL